MNIFKKLFSCTQKYPLKNPQYEIFTNTPIFFLILSDMLLMEMVDFLWVVEFLLSPKPMDI